MRLAFYTSLPEQERRALLRRAITLSLVIAGHLLVLFLLFLPGAPIQRLLKIEPKVFSVLSYTEAKNVEKPAPRAKKAGATAQKKPATPPTPTAQPAPTKPLNMMMLSKEDFAAADISKIPHRAAGTPGDNGMGSSDGGADAAGTGPGGEKLYNAEWYVEPTAAQLAPYLPRRNLANGWGEIMCKMIDHYHVEDCRELNESPLGSGISRALRQAAWQFLVRPPRVGDRKLIGEWVRIRYNFYEKEAKPSD